MEHKLFSQNSNKLIILFSGWSCHPNQFSDLIFDGYDLLVLYNYNNIELEFSDFNKYNTHTIIAWSFGVWAAEAVSQLLPKNSLYIALNGTPTPIHDTLGIPQKIFKLTLQSIERSGIDKFNERMCDNKIKNFIKSEREFTSQLQELHSLSTLSQTINIATRNWDYTIIGSKDKIFPLKNMLNYWDKKSNFAPIILDIPHYPFTAECIVKLTELLNFDR